MMHLLRKDDVWWWYKSGLFFSWNSKNSLKLRGHSIVVRTCIGACGLVVGFDF